MEKETNPTSTQPKNPEQPATAPGIIFAIIGATSGIFTTVRLTSILPVWAALMIAFVIWFVLVASMTAACGSEMLDILVGSVTIVIVMILVVEGGIRIWQHHHQKTSPTVINQSTAMNDFKGPEAATENSFG